MAYGEGLLEPVAPRTNVRLPPLPLKLNDDSRHSVPTIERSIAQKYRGEPLRILEAGCGAKWPLTLEDVSYRLTAVDIDVTALEIRKSKVRDVDDIQVGDLRTSTLFPPSSFDVIYNSFVLEHIEGAEGVLDNFLCWLAPGGLLILRIPDRDSVYGFITRYTPFGLHVMYKKYVQGIRTAGTPGHGPYKTYHDPIVSRGGIHRYCRSHGCAVVYEAGYAGYLPRHPVLGPLARACVRAVAAASFGRLEWRYNNLTFVIER